MTRGISKPDTERLMASARARLHSAGSIPPTITYCSEMGQVAELAAYCSGDEPVPIEQAVSEGLMALWDHLGPAAWVSVVADTYVREREPTPAAREKYASLADAFAGGDPSVCEQLVLVCATRDGEQTGIRQVYRFLPSEGWEFDPIKDWTPDDEVAAELRTFLTGESD